MFHLGKIPSTLLKCCKQNQFSGKEITWIWLHKIKVSICESRPLLASHLHLFKWKIFNLKGILTSNISFDPHHRWEDQLSLSQSQVSARESQLSQETQLLNRKTGTSSLYDHKSNVLSTYALTFDHEDVNNEQAV